MLAKMLTASVMLIARQCSTAGHQAAIIIGERRDLDRAT